MVYTTTRLSTRESDIEARVQNAIDAIVNESDPLGQNILSYGSGVSSHLKHRQLDIPNGDVADFIMTNPIQVMQPILEEQRQSMSSLKHLDIMILRLLLVR